MMTGLSLENLSMRFDLPGGGTVQALNDVSLTLARGELLSVLDARSGSSELWYCAAKEGGSVYAA